MPLNDRLVLLEKIEEIRNRPIVVYCTSARPGATGSIAADALPELLDQLVLLPTGCKSIDLLIVSNGGDPTTAWRIISLLRERVDYIGVLVPQASFSAATLIALGGNEIVMHPCGNLGPVDPQIEVQKASPQGQGQERISFGSEDLSAFLRFARENVGLTDQEHLKSAFELVCKEAGAVPIGVSARAAQLSVSMCEKLLKMHMAESEGQKAKALAETLNKAFFHHGYPVGRREAKEIGLKVVEPPPPLEDAMWKLWLDIEREMECRTPFSPMSIISAASTAQALFEPVPMVTVPAGLPQNLQQQAYQQVLASVQLTAVPAVEYSDVLAVIESRRRTASFIRKGKLFAQRDSSLKIAVSNVTISAGWQQTVPTT